MLDQREANLNMPAFARVIEELRRGTRGEEGDNRKQIVIEKLLKKKRKDYKWKDYKWKEREV